MDNMNNSSPITPKYKEVFSQVHAIFIRVAKEITDSPAFCYVTASVGTDETTKKTSEVYMSIRRQNNDGSSELSGSNIKYFRILAEPNEDGVVLSVINRKDEIASLTPIFLNGEDSISDKKEARIIEMAITSAAIIQENAVNALGQGWTNHINTHKSHLTARLG